MATVVLQVAGSVLGSIVGGPVGAAIGQAIGAAAGAAIDASLLAAATSGGGRAVEGPRLKELEVMTSTEGAPIPRVYGRARVGGQVIWATPIEETATTIRERGRSKGAPSTKRIEYSYHVNLAVGLCEGPIAFVRRVWADGHELDLTGIEMRVHGGGEDQAADPLIVAREGAGNAPAYRGLAYAVFERLPLAEFGNRIPQLAFEVVRPVDGLARMIRAVCLIPGASEFALAPGEVVRVMGPVATAPENRHQLFARADIHASLDALQALCPNLERVSVVTSWFGDDLRAGRCTIAPRTEAGDRETLGGTWSVARLTRGSARVVSRVDGRPPFSARLNKALWTARPVAEGGDGDLRYTLNKEGAGDVLSLLFQSGFSGWAELGLVGDDDLVLKVSGDGAAWREALRVDRTTGAARFPGLPRFSATLAGDPAIPAGTWTRIPFDGAALDDGGAFDAATGRFTALVAGAYRLDAAATVRVTGAVPTDMGIALHRNGVAITATQAGAAGLVDGISGVATGAVLGLAAGDVMEVRARFGGAAAAVLGARSRFSGHLLP